MLGNNNKKDQKISSDIGLDFAKDLNTFYTRFDCHNFDSERQSVLDSLNDEDVPSITIEDVEKSFSKINIRKACGPDKLAGIVLKECREQLSVIFAKLYQISLSTHTLPDIWKTSNIIPIPKKSNPQVLNDYRPVALTPIVMKCLVRKIKFLLLKDTDQQFDNLQFAYRPKLGTEDAIITLLHGVYEHLDKPKTHARLLFVDFSSAFNTIQVYLLLNKLKSLNVNSNVIKWVDSFMLNRTQYVTVNGFQSPVLRTSTGAPQGCVTSPILFILYTNDFVCNYPDCLMIKFADDTVLTGLISDSDENYQKAVAHLVTWCKENYLYLNTSKTKEMIIDFRKDQPDITPLKINSESIERVDNYKYLGTFIDCRLSWNHNTKHLYKKGQQRLFFLRKLNQFHVDKTIMTLFYRTFIQSILCFSFICWFDSLSEQCRDKLNNIVETAGKIIGCTPERLETLYKKQVLSKARKIRKNEQHFLSSKYEMLPSERRLKTVFVKTDRFRYSFIPSSIRLMNRPQI